MNNHLLAEWLDNPIFVKHIRSRLRPQPRTSPPGPSTLLATIRETDLQLPHAWRTPFTSSGATGSTTMTAGWW